MEKPKVLRLTTVLVDHLSELYTDDCGGVHLSGVEGTYMDIILKS